MANLLHIDSSARRGSSDSSRFGSHTRRLTGQFVNHWRRLRQSDCIMRRDLALNPPRAVDDRWIQAAFTKPEAREPWMHDVLTESDLLVDELLKADVIVLGVPMYNFGVPSTFKAYIDNIVRVGRTFGFDRNRQGEPYWPLLSSMHKFAIIHTARGDFGYDDGKRIAHANHVEPAIRTALGYIGITDISSVAVEYDEFADERLQSSISEAERCVDVLVTNTRRKLELRQLKKTG